LDPNYKLILGFGIHSMCIFRNWNLPKIPRWLKFYHPWELRDYVAIIRLKNSSLKYYFSSTRLCRFLQINSDNCSSQHIFLWSMQKTISTKYLLVILTPYFCGSCLSNADPFSGFNSGTLFKIISNFPLNKRTPRIVIIFWLSEFLEYIR